MARRYAKKGKRIYKKKKALKRYIRKRKTNANLVKMPSTIVSDRCITKLKYCEQHTMSLDGLNYSNIVYRGNGPYDPRYATGGGFPSGFKEWGRFFGRYKVYGSKIKVTFMNSTNELQQQNLYVAVQPHKNPTLTATTIDNLFEQPFTKNKIYNPINPYPAVLKHYIGTEKLLGLNKKGVETEQDMSAPVNGLPLKEWYWHVIAQPVAQESAAVIARVEITYYVEFYQRNELNEDV